MNTRSGADPGGVAGGLTRVKLIRLSALLILVNGMLLAPWWILTGGFAPPWLAFEALLLIGAFAVLPDRPWRRWAAGAAALLVLLFAVLGLGETATRLSLGRPLNLYVDFWLLDSVRDLLVGALGGPVATLTLVLAPLAAVGTTAVVAMLLTRVRVRPDGSAPPPGRKLAAALAVFVAAGLIIEVAPPLARFTDAPTLRLTRDQSVRFVQMMNERSFFQEKLAEAPESYADLPGLLGGLGGRDVILAFLESYGMAALTDARYAPVVGPRLDDFEARMRGAGLPVVSGTLVAPSQGGQSWFGHGSLLSGVWLDNQLRYDMMLASGRETLIDDFQRAGYRAVAVMPAITSVWPEGARFGYDEVYARDRIDYAGPALNWVTMPDQFTWSFLERRIRKPADRPVFAELGLISSHAPWTPILPVLDDWDAIGDGSVFDAYTEVGPSPEEIWGDPERIREHYAMSVEYAVHAMAAYAERYVDDRTLLIVLGDHQPAPVVTGEDVVWDVPVHVVSGDRATVEPFLEWGFTEGAWPKSDPGRETLGVDFFRDWFLRAYSGP